MPVPRPSLEERQALPMWAAPIVLLIAVGQTLSTGDKLIEPRRVNAVVVPKGSSVKLKTKSGKQMRSALTSDEKIARASQRSVSGRTAIELCSLTEGATHVSLTDVDGKEDKVIVIVEKGELAVYHSFGTSVGERFSVTVTRQALASSPSWKGTEENPPLS